MQRDREAEKLETNNDDNGGDDEDGGDEDDNDDDFLPPRTPTSVLSFRLPNSTRSQFPS